MASYYPSFNYLGINSREKNLVVAHFDDDYGDVNTFLGMEPIYTESADGSTRLDYGAKFNNVATFKLSLIKQDGGDFSVKDVRDTLKWLTGARKNSPLDLAEHFLEEFIFDGITTSYKLVNSCSHIYYVSINNTKLSSNQWYYDKSKNSIVLNVISNNGSVIKVAYNRIKYSFIGRITNAWQQKMDARTIGIIVEFTSVSPWAYSPIQVTTQVVSGNKTININCQTDDVYSYVYTNVKYTNSSGTSVIIKNNTIGETTEIYNLAVNETVTISDKLFISSDNPIKTFGNAFNFVYPRLAPGNNEFIIIGNGTIVFEYVVPLKVGDCAMDIVVISDPICNEDGEIVLDTLSWSRVVDTPKTLSGYGITNAYTKTEVNKLISDQFSNVYTKNDVNTKINVIYDEVYTKAEVEEKIKEIILSEDDDVEVETISWYKITDTPESLGGYGITNAYTKIEIDEKINNIYTKEEIDKKISSASIDINEMELQDMLAQIFA